MNRYKCQCGRIIDRSPHKVGKYCKDCKPQNNNTKHLMSDSFLYKTWAGMKNRCRENDYRHKRYYDRGITVCEEWMDFENFFSWAKESGYRHGLLIDRINNDMGYSPENCRWVTYAKNARNSDSVVLNEGVAKLILEMKDSGLRCSEISKKLGFRYATVYAVFSGRAWR